MKKILLVAIAMLCAAMMYAQGIYQMWGMTVGGGKDDIGVIFSLDEHGNNYKIHHQFTIINPGSMPRAGLAEYKGKFYSTTSWGGLVNDMGEGVIYEWDPITNSYTKKIQFSNSIDGAEPYADLIEVDGKFYGTTFFGGTNGYGVIFEWNPVTNLYTKRVDLSWDNGCQPTGRLTYNNGKFYGMVSSGGENSKGAIFEWNPTTNVYTKKIDFNGDNGSQPWGSLTYYNGNFYGMTLYGGSNDKGVIFEWNPIDNSYAKKVDFTGANGSLPRGSLIVKESKLYGMTGHGGIYDQGVIFEWSPTNNIFTKRVDFNGINGSNPQNDLLFLNDRFYGTCSTGGTNNKGVVFEWDPSSNVFLKKVDLNGANGASPFTHLNFKDGKLYSVGITGILEIDPVTNECILKARFNYTEAGYPMGALTFNNGNLFGITSLGVGGPSLFELNPATNSFNIRISLGSENGDPTGSLTLYNGKFYSMTTSGGLNNEGVIFEFDPSNNVYSKKLDFKKPGPSKPFFQNLTPKNGKLYGMSFEGGANNLGVIFEWDPITNIIVNKIHFDGINGGSPLGNLSLLNDKFYGMTSGGGVYGAGVIFEWDPATNVYLKKIDFKDEIGASPSGSLTLLNNKFYGLTPRGGKQYGTIFQWDPAKNEFSKQFDFTLPDGSNPRGSLTASGGKLYGLTSFGDKVWGGIFEWDPDLKIFSKKVDFDGVNGNQAGPGNNLVLAPTPVAPGATNSCTTFPSITIDSSNNNQWVSIIDEENKAVAEIKANGNNLGIITASMYINSGAVRKDNGNQSYLDRNISFTPQVQPTTPVDVRLYIKASEYEALKNAAPGLMDSITDLKIYPSNTNCSPAITALNNAVTTTAGNWEGDYVLSAKVNSLASFFFAAKTSCTAPVISNMLISRDTLWPPNHCFKNVGIAYKVSGNCKCDPITRWITVKSNEPETGIDNGDKGPDWIIEDANHVKLRAERNPHGNGRIYTVTIHAKNKAGISSSYDFNVRVPLNMSEGQQKKLLAKKAAMMQAEEETEALSCDVTPNPSANYFNLQVQSSSDKPIEITLLDGSGRLIDKQATYRSKTIRMGEQLKPGIYMLQLKQGAQQKIIRLVKQ